MKKDNIVSQWRHRISFLKRVSVTAAGGRVLDRYDPIAVVWGHVQFDGGDAIKRAGRRQFQQKITVETYYLQRLLAAERVEIDGKTYEVSTMVDPDGLQQMLTLDATSIL